MEDLEYCMDPWIIGLMELNHQWFLWWFHERINAIQWQIYSRALTLPTWWHDVPCLNPTEAKCIIHIILELATYCHTTRQKLYKWTTESWIQSWRVKKYCMAFNFQTVYRSIYSTAMHPWTHRWIRKFIHAWMYERDAWLDGWMYPWIDGWMDPWTVTGSMKGSMDRWMDVPLLLVLWQSTDSIWHAVYALST